MHDSKVTHFATRFLTDTNKMGTILTSRFEDLSLNCVARYFKFFLYEFDYALDTPILGLKNRDFCLSDITLSQFYTQKELNELSENLCQKLIIFYLH